MGSDRARVSFDRSRQWRAVIAQQGRVSLEADLNEQVAIDASRGQLTTRELVGPCASPDGGYQVSATPASGGPAGSTPGDLSVSAGTLYLGGERLRLEQALTYSRQPEWLNAAEDPLYVAPAAPAGDAFELVYLLAFEQEVSAVEDPTLADVALGGPDTAQRLRIVQRVVRAASTTGNRTSAWSELESKWSGEGYSFDSATMQRTSTATLQVSFTQELAAPTPCQPVATGGYLEAENQLLRVAIAEVQSSGVPYVVWAKDDASSLYRVSSSVYDAEAQETTVTLASAPVDSDHYPAKQQFVELLANAVELSGEAGVAAPSGFLAEVAVAYNAGERTVVLSGQLPPEYLQASAAQAPSLYLRVWEEKLPAPAGSAVALGASGVAVTLDSSDGAFHVGDFWQFALRPIEPTIVYPARIQEAPQPPDGPRTWACPLAVVSWAEGTPSCTNCVEGFTNLLKLSEDVGGCCTVVLRPADVEDGAALASLLAGYASKGPVTVCLEPGTYTLPQPLVLGPEHDGLILQAPRGETVLAAPASPGQEFLLGLIVITGASSVSLRGLELRLPPTDFSPTSGAFASLSSANVALLSDYAAELAVAIGVTVQGASDLSLCDCRFAFPAAGGRSLFAAGVYASGTIERLTLDGCSFSLAPEPTAAPFAGLARGASTEPPYELAFGYLQVPSASETSSTAEAGAGGTPATPATALAKALPTAIEDPARAPLLKPEALTLSPDPGLKEPIVDPSAPVLKEPIFDPGEPVLKEPIVEPSEPVLKEPILEPGAPILKQPIFKEPIIGPSGPSGAERAESTLATGEQAASVASLTLPTLHDALIEGCVFEGLTLPVLGLAHLGTIRLERNTIRACYGGIWLVSFENTGAMTMFDQIGSGESSLWTEFNEAGTSALLDRVYVMAFAMGQVLPITPPDPLTLLPARIIDLPNIDELERVRTTLGDIFHTAEEHSAGGPTSSSEPSPGGESTPGAAAGASGSGTPSAAGEAAARLAPRADLQTSEGDIGKTSIAASGLQSSVGIIDKVPIVLKAFPHIENLLERIGARTAPAPPPIEAVETGESVMLRLAISDSQIDSVVEDSNSGAGIVVFDMTSSPGSLLFNNNRVRTRFPEGEAALVLSVAEAALTGNIIANEVAASLTAAQSTTSRSLALQPAKAATTVVALTGNALVSAAKLPERHEASTPPPWSALNAIVEYVAPAKPPAAGTDPESGAPSSTGEAAAGGSGTAS
jgi:hypothetical protein